MPANDAGIFRDNILYAFKKRQTAFLTTESLLKEVRFQKAINPKEDKERLDSILEEMRIQELVILNQPKLVALSDKGKAEAVTLTEARIVELEKASEERTK